MGTAAQAGSIVSESKPAGCRYREEGAPREWNITFVHRVRNAAAQALCQVDIAVGVPRSDERQTILSSRFLPEPAKVSRDGWDQETVHYYVAELPPGAEAEVRLETTVSLRDVEWLVTDRDVGGAEEIPGAVARQFLRDGENYCLDQGVVKEAAVRLAASVGQAPTGAGYLERLRRVHDFVLDSLEYSRDNRWDPADRVLLQHTGSCSEYSYLMIALCRLNGIPARYAGGTWFELDGCSPPRLHEPTPSRASFATSAAVSTRPAAGAEKPEETRAVAAGGAGMTDDSPYVDRIFHRWVEVYLPRVGWFPVDPTQDDRAEKEGAPYRFFGRLPWSYLAMTRGDGDRLESGSLGWDYRSSTKWLERQGVSRDDVIEERYALWKPARTGAVEVTTAATMGN